ncbi:MAG: YceI family protein [Cytophagales bacterium]
MEQVLTKTKWAIDPTHSEVQFKVKHLVITTVTGHFSEFSGELETENSDFDKAKAKFSINVSSVNTNQPDRDNHLKSAEFFDVEHFPNIDFDGHLVKGGSNYSLVGELSIKGVKKEVNFPVDFGGLAKDPWGNTKAGFEISGTINRKDFGLTWNVVTESGGLLVSEDVKLILNVQVAKQ